MPSDVARAIRIISREFIERYPEEAAQELETLPPEEAARFLEGQEPSQAAAILQRIRPDAAAECIAGIGDSGRRALLRALDPARAAALLAREETDRRDRDLALLEPGLAEEIRALMAYPRDCAGGLMDPRFLSFRPDESVHDALERVRGLGQRRVHDLFLIDGEGRLAGFVPLQEAAIAPGGERLGALSRGAPPRVQATASREEVLEELQSRRLPGLPVVDIDQHLLGVIRHAALIAAAQEEASLDIQTMVGASRDERALSSPVFVVRKRLPWLQVNLATAFLAAAVVGLFEETIARFTALAVLLPVVAGQSGNTGSQALAVTMRGLALREIRARHWMRVSVKEIVAALANGAAVGAVTGLAVYLWSGSIGLTLVIGVSMVVSMSIAGLSGATIPIILTKLGQDPAQASSIILTTVTDVVGFLSFLGIATSLSFML